MSGRREEGGKAAGSGGGSGEEKASMAVMSSVGRRPKTLGGARDDGEPRALLPGHPLSRGSRPRGVPGKKVFVAPYVSLVPVFALAYLSTEKPPGVSSHFRRVVRELESLPGRPGLWVV